MLLQQSRLAARFDAQGEIILLDDQDRSLWDGKLISEGLALVDKALRHNRPGPYQVQAAIAAIHSRAARAADTDWAGIDHLYLALERMQPSPVVTLNRAVAVAKLQGPAAALAMIEPLENALSGYFYYFGTRGAFLLQLGRKPGSPHGLRSRHRIGQHAGGSRPYPPPSGPSDGLCGGVIKTA